MHHRHSSRPVLVGISLVLLLIGAECKSFQVRSVDSQQPARCRLTRPRSSQNSPCTEGNKFKRFFLHESNPRGCKRFGICPNDAAQHDAKVNDGEENYFLDYESCQMECMRHVLCPELVVLPDSNVHVYSDNNLQGWGKKVVYECNNGYSLLQNTKRYERVCQKNGTWSGEPPVCLEQCQGPPAISHANIAPAKNVHNQGSSVHYACDVGYRLEGTSQRRCGPNGKWAGTEPSCVCAVALMNGKCPNCHEPSPLENGHVTAPNRSVNAVIHYRCKEGYILTGSSSRSCLEKGVWSGNEPMCWKMTIEKGVSGSNEREDVTNKTVTVEFGSKNVVFEAVTIGSKLFNEYEVEWSFSGTNGKTELPHALSENGQLITFSTILKSKEQEGNYTIKFGNFSASFALEAENKTEGTEGRLPIIEHDPMNLTGSVGLDARFYCIGSGEPVPKLTWYHNNRTITPDARHIIMKHSSESITIGVLIILPVQSTDSGTYHCSAKNAAGSVVSYPAQLSIGHSLAKRSIDQGTGQASLCNRKSADAVTLLGRVRKMASSLSQSQAKNYKVHIKQVLHGSSAVEALRTRSVRTIVLRDNLFEDREDELKANTDYVLQGRLLGKTLVVFGDSVHRYTPALQQQLALC